MGGSGSPQLDLEGCEQCASILNSFFDAYHKMKCLELHIHWKIYTLIRIMREARKVPSRIGFLKEICGGDGDQFKYLMKMRNQTIETCSRGLKRCAPKVRLERLKTLENGLPPESSPTEPCSKSLLFLSNWISSFAAVLVLLSLSPTNFSVDSAPTEYNEDEGLRIEEDFSIDGVSQFPNELQSKETTYCPLNTLKSERDGAGSNEFRVTGVSVENNIDNNESEASSYDDYDHENSNPDSVPYVDESSEFENAYESACKEEHYAVGDEASHDNNLLEVVDNQATALDSKDLQKLEKPDNNLFRCTCCFKRFPKKGNLKKHVSRKHPEMKSISKSAPYSCEMCVTEYTSYHSYLVHKRTFSHREKMKRKLIPKLNENPIKHPNSTTIAQAIKNDVGTSSLTTDLQQETKEKRYNLRRKSWSPMKGMDVESNESTENSDGDDYSFDSSDSSASSNSNCSDKSDNEKSDGSDGIPSTIKTRKRKKRKISKGTTILRCPSDACKNYWTVHQKAYEEHLNLHKPGQYKCNFCEVIESSAFDLSIHELTDHSKITKHPRNRARLYHCPRCEYHTQLGLPYTLHFARHHLGFTRDSRYEACPICKVKCIDYRQGSHFSRCHDTTGVEPDKILKCNSENCTAYFTNKSSRLRHKRVVHVDETYADENHLANGKLQCDKCVKTFKTQSGLKEHINKNLFHNMMDLNIASSDTTKKTPFGTMICPAPNCSRNFKRMEALDRHQKLHGSFQCNFCEVVKEYAPDLALHELDHGGTMEKADGAGKWQCPRCAFKCKLQSNTAYVTHHLEAHLGLTDRLYSCSICHMRLRMNNEKGRHFNAYHRTDDPEVIKKCGKCPAYFLTEKQLYHHKHYICKNNATKALNPSTGRPFKHKQYKLLEYKCSISECVESFDNPKSLELHGKLHGDFKCQFCAVSKEYALDLASHELEHVDMGGKTRNSFSCSRCSFSVSKEACYLGHFLETHLKLSAKLHSCSICSASLLTRDSIRRHLKDWHNNRNDDHGKMERCDQCPAYFIKKCQLLWHQRFIHNVGRDYKHLKCNICDKSYKSEKSLISHQHKFHDEGKISENLKFLCDLDNCKMQFETKNELDWHRFCSPFHRKGKGHHLKNHQKEKCHECGKECSGVIALKVHMRVHRKDRPTEFKCDQCDKIFKTKGKLQNHQKFHLGPDKWEFMCSICSKKCFDKWTLQLHMKTHSKEKPFVCQLCGGKYAHRHNLRNHVNSKHKDQGVQDIPKKVNRKYFVSRKGKKLTRDFCFIKAQDNDEDLERNE